MASTYNLKILLVANLLDSLVASERPIFFCFSTDFICYP